MFRASATALGVSFLFFEPLEIFAEMPEAPCAFHQVGWKLQGGPTNLCSAASRPLRGPQEEEKVHATILRFDGHDGLRWLLGSQEDRFFFFGLRTAQQETKYINLVPSRRQPAQQRCVRSEIPSERLRKIHVGFVYSTPHL